MERLVTPDEKDRTGEQSQYPRYPGTPRWIKVSATIIAVLALLMVMLVHAGGGPRHNVRPADAGGAPSSKDNPG